MSSGAFGGTFTQITSDKYTCNQKKLPAEPAEVPAGNQLRRHMPPVRVQTHPKLNRHLPYTGIVGLSVTRRPVNSPNSGNVGVACQSLDRARDSTAWVIYTWTASVTNVVENKIQCIGAQDMRQYSVAQRSNKYSKDIRCYTSTRHNIKGVTRAFPNTYVVI